MPITRAYLEVVKGPGLGRKLLLREDQVKYVGRTDQADDACPENPEMSSVHFSVRWLGGQCEIKDLNSANGTFKGGVKISEAVLFGGDEIKAGKAVFRLVIEDESGQRQSPARDTAVESMPFAPEPPTPRQPAGSPTIPFGSVAVAPPPTPAAAPRLPRGLVLASAQAVARLAPLADENKQMLVDDMPATQYVELLASREQFMDAIRVLAYALGKPSAVLWACRCIRRVQGDDLSAADKDALAAAEAWAVDFKEEHRRAAHAAAEAANHETAASWAAMAAFFADGSLAPPHAPVVPPGETLTAHAASGAVMLAAVARNPDKINDTYRQFLQFGLELANEK
jgi:hypothetical protein